MVSSNARARGKEDVEALAAILGWAFGFPTSGMVEWLNGAGLENVRVERRRSRVVAGLLEIPMGQWFGGRSVPALGIAGVAVDPEARGKGLALGMMQSTLREARERGLALSTLYPATLTLYRAAGYELAGTYCRWNVRTADCPRAPAKLELRAIEAADQAAVEGAYGKLARTRPGYLERPSYVWKRVRAPMGEPARGYLVRGKRDVEGYVYVSQRGTVGSEQSLALTDFVALTPAAAADLLTFVAQHRSTVEQVSWHGPPVDGNMVGFPEKVFRIEPKFWMLRVVDVCGALAARGYPPVDVDVALHVEDGVLPENSGSYRLSVSGGRGEVDKLNSRGSQSASARLDVRALAALYSGFMSPSELSRAGLLEASTTTEARLAALFSGPPPALPDFF